MDKLIENYIKTNKPDIDQLNILQNNLKDLFENIADLNSIIDEKIKNMDTIFENITNQINYNINHKTLLINQIEIPYNIKNIIDDHINNKYLELEELYKNNTDKYNFNKNEYNLNMFFVDSNHNIINYNDNIIGKYDNENNTIYNILANYKTMFINNNKETTNNDIEYIESLNTYDVKENTHYFFTLKNNGNIKLEKEYHINNITTDLEELLNNKEEQGRLEFLNNKHFYGLGEIGIFLHNKFDENTTSIIDSRMAWGICIDKDFLPIKQIKSIYDYDESNITIITVAGKENRTFYVDNENNIFYPAINKFDKILGKYDNINNKIIELFNPDVFPSTAIINVEKLNGSRKTKIILMDNDKDEYIIKETNEITNNNINMDDFITNIENELEKTFIKELNNTKFYLLDMIKNNNIKKKDLACSITLLGELKKIKRDKFILKIFRHGEIVCSCSTFKNNMNENNNIWCNHIFYILLKVGKLYDKELYNKKIINHEEIDEIMDNIENRKNQDIIYKEHDNLTYTDFKSSNKELTLKDDCKLCYNLLGEDINKTICCPDCENYIHKDCAEIYINLKNECLYCNSKIWTNFNEIKNNYFL